MSTSSGIQRDIISAYLVTGARVLAWIAVTATVMRVAGKLAFALLGLVQSTVGVLEYAAIGLSPAIIRLTAEAIRAHMQASAQTPNSNPQETIIEYETAHGPDPAIRAVYANGFAMALLTALGGAVAMAIFLPLFRMTKTNRQTNDVAFEIIFMVGVATLLRMMSDAPGAALQTRGKIFLDNLILALHEIIWAVGTVIGLYLLHLPWQRATGYALLAGSGTVLVVRSICSHQYGSGVFDHWWKQVRGPTVRRLLVFGGMVVAAQMADYLYAPTNNLIITAYIDVKTVADYGPAVQIDGGMLLVASALASVLLPRTALAHAAGHSLAVRRYYIRGTVATTILLAIGAVVMWLAAPRIFTIWLGNPMPETCAILPLMLIHTVIGGASAVGRAILLAIGKVRTFTISVLLAGVANVVLSIIFVHYLNLGLKGIVLGTIVAVVARCAFWLPWYTLRVLKQEENEAEEAVLETIPPRLP